MSRLRGAADEAEELIRQHRSPDNLISSDEINNHIRVDTTDGKENTRKIVRHLIFERGIPIGTPGQHYYVIDSDAGLERTMAYYDSRITALLQRKRAIRYAYEGTTFHDEEFEKEPL